ncbi:MAG: hypothetical protein QW416_01175 [Candidatus Nitrosocaldaceae archaeon]
MLDDTAKLKELCSKVLELDSKIRYVGIINSYGKTITGKIKKGVKPLFKSEDAMNEFFITAIREMLRKTFENSLGKHILTLTIHENVNSIVFSIDKNIVYITFEKDSTFEEMFNVAKKTKELFR